MLDIAGNPVSRAFFEDLTQHDPFASLRRHTGSSLVIHGSSDEVVPSVVGERYAAALETRFHAVQGGGHTFDSLTQQAEVLRATLEFFQQSL
jgi:fermentation-respiration switch protein FrsA (DUF1100 family)